MAVPFQKLIEQRKRGYVKEVKTPNWNMGERWELDIKIWEVSHQEQFELRWWMRSLRN